VGCGPWRSAGALARAFGIALAALLVLPLQSAARERRQLGQPLYTIETEHFRINYHAGVEHVARRAGGMLEELYARYTQDYRLVLPRKTEVLVTSTEDNENSFASANTNLIAIAANDFGIDWFLRGSGNYLRDVVAHEFAHIVSITSGMKAPPWLLGVQVGRFTHPNDYDGGEGEIAEIMHIFPFENLPPWFSEGIAQYESARMGGDRWDTHRDMIMRTLTLSGRLLSWDHMAVFSGRGDDYEKTYNHGFSLVEYIAEKYGHGALVTILHEGGRMLRVNFDRAVKQSLGISARSLCREWKASLEARYRRQVDSLGAQVFGRKINKDGWDNRFPRFSPDGGRLYFISNGKSDFSYEKTFLYSYSFADTLKEDKRIRREALPVSRFYDIHDSLRLVVFPSVKSARSTVPFREGGGRRFDVFIDSLPPEKEPSFLKALFTRDTERRLTRRQSLFAASFSPSGNRLAVTQHRCDRFYLCVMDTAEGALPRIVYPDTADSQNAIQTIYSVDWSPDGRRIALSYVKGWGDRKVGIYDTLDRTFRTIGDTPGDERDPRFSPDGRRLYFASDRTGIFNIYRCSLDSGTVERVTNVSGGAFMPDISPDERRLAYVNYDKDGYGVYLLDSMRALAPVAADSLAPPPDTAPAAAQAVLSAPERYNRFPRQFLMVPTLLSEQAVTERDDPYAGEDVFKAGLVFYLFDPFSWVRGNEIGGYFLVEPDKIFRFFDAKTTINPEVDWDLGLFGSTEYLPFRVDAEYLMRSIAGEDVYLDNNGERLHLLYNLSPRVFNLWATKSLGDFSNVPLNVHAVASYNWYRIHLFLEEYSRSAFTYTAAKGYRLGTYLTLVKKNTDRLFWVAPRGLALKVAYDFCEQRLQNDEERFDDQWLVNYDYYSYHQVSGSMQFGWKMPWSRRERLYCALSATAVEPTQSTADALRSRGKSPTIPSFYEPVAWLPGYAFYYRDYVPRQANTGQDSIVDTVLISGNAVATINASFRFPLWPRSIDRKLGFIYFDNIYAAVNARAGAGWYHPSDMLRYRRSDWITTIGAELRLETFTFNRYPMAVSLRWDRGLDRPEPIGGDRFTLSIGFTFEDWEMLERPDYYAAPVDARAPVGSSLR